jgi:hypothetical protein
MAEQSAKGDCYRLKISSRNHVSRAKGKGWVNNHSGNKSTIRGYLRGKRVLSINSNALLRIVAENS